MPSNLTAERSNPEDAQWGPVELYNFDNGQRYIDFHVVPKSILKTDTRDVKESFAQLAMRIHTKHPDVTAVAGGSWLMSRIGERFGFTITRRLNVDTMEHRDKRENPFHYLGYWMQLINESGEIREDMKQRLFTQGTLPHNLAFGKMSRDEFLERFLPKQ